MKALSTKQPWAWLIVHGYKDIENRTWQTSFRGVFLIHCGKTHDGEPDDWGWPKIPEPDRFDYGGIIGQAELVDCISSSRSPWFHGPFGFVIRNPEPLPFRPCRGTLGFFTPDFTPAAPKPEKPAKTILAPRQAELFSHN